MVEKCEDIQPEDFINMVFGLENLTDESKKMHMEISAMNETYQPTEKDVKEVKEEALKCLNRALEIAQLLDHDDKEEAVYAAFKLFEEDLFDKE